MYPCNERESGFHQSALSLNEGCTLRIVFSTILKYTYLHVYKYTYSYACGYIHICTWRERDYMNELKLQTLLSLKENSRRDR